VGVTEAVLTTGIRGKIRIGPPINLEEGLITEGWQALTYYLIGRTHSLRCRLVRIALEQSLNPLVLTLDVNFLDSATIRCDADPRPGG
jgi:hypothetical protein